MKEGNDRKLKIYLFEHVRGGVGISREKDAKRLHHRYIFEEIITQMEKKLSTYTLLHRVSPCNDLQVICNYIIQKYRIVGKEKRYLSYKPILYCNNFKQISNVDFLIVTLTNIYLILTRIWMYKRYKLRFYNYKSPHSTHSL